MTLGEHETHKPKAKHNIYSRYTPKCFIYVMLASLNIFILLQVMNMVIKSHKCTTSASSLSLSSHSSLSQSAPMFVSNSSLELKLMTDRLRESVTFLPLKDLRFSQKPQVDHTWFMSSLNDTQVDGGAQHQHFPSEDSGGRLLCIKGHDRHDGTKNYYALAWPDTLPSNATLMKRLTYISYNHYDYFNIWHGLSATVPFASWRVRNGCKVPSRWILYHWGELRSDMNLWVRSLLRATHGTPVHMEDFSGIDDVVPVCFEEAVVMRHNEGGMSKERRLEKFDFVRCQARKFCNLSVEGWGTDIDDPVFPSIKMTLLLRTGGRSFKNDSAVIEIFEKECAKVVGCQLMFSFPHTLTFCEQVKLLSSTDIVVSPHGAQLSNLIFMERNSSIMEFFPKGWLKLAGVGQLVFRWLASWSGMRHQGYWHDPDGAPCPYPEDDRRCMSVYKNGQLGYNETYFSEWARRVLNETKIRKMEEASNKKTRVDSARCACP